MFKFKSFSTLAFSKKAFFHHSLNINLVSFYKAESRAVKEASQIFSLASAALQTLRWSVSQSWRWLCLQRWILNIVQFCKTHRVDCWWPPVNQSHRSARSRSERVQSRPSTDAGCNNQLRVLKTHKTIYYSFIHYF